MTLLLGYLMFEHSKVFNYSIIQCLDPFLCENEPKMTFYMKINWYIGNESVSLETTYLFDYPPKKEVVSRRFGHDQVSWKPRVESLYKILHHIVTLVHHETLHIIPHILPKQGVWPFFQFSYMGFAINPLQISKNDHFSMKMNWYMKINQFP